jgi:hypothetical protein
MPKLSAEQPGADAIIRVEITPQMLNETNEDGSFKFTDDQLRDWLTKLRGDREIVMAKAQQKASSEGRPKAPRGSVGLSEDDLT